MTGRVRQRINFGDGHTLGARSNQHDLVSGFDLSLLDDLKSQPRTRFTSCGSATLAGD
jgi:hypothetical protein